MGKIGILTFPNSPSYGASLQMYALYEVLKQYGYDIEVINYINEYMFQKKHIYVGRLGSVKREIANVVNSRKDRQFRQFENRINLYPPIPVHTHDELKNISSRYTHVICGSDQVWNPYITDADMSYFLDFCSENVIKIAYAPSFGIDTVPEGLMPRFAEALNRINFLSVREASGQKIISDLTGRECKLVVDPTMLLESTAWHSLTKVKKGLPPKYIAKFIFNADPLVDRCINNISIKYNIPVLNIGKTRLSIGRMETYTGPIGPEEWLYCVNNAEFVVTDSFHGLAFSIIFEKQVYISMASKTNTRLAMLAEISGLTDRIITEDAIERKTLDEEIDYRKVNKMIDSQRSASLNYLMDSLK